MKRINCGKYLILASLILFCATNHNAQKGTSNESCVENNADEYCIEFDPVGYLGNYSYRAAADTNIPLE